MNLSSSCATGSKTVIAGGDVSIGMDHIHNLSLARQALHEDTSVSSQAKASIPWLDPMHKSQV